MFHTRRRPGYTTDGLASLDQVLERRRADSQTLLEVERAFNSLKAGYDFIEDRLALMPT